MDEKIAIIGLGYVGLPVALAFAKRYRGTIGFDISERRVSTLGDGLDYTGEVDPETLKSSTIRFSTTPTDLEGATFFVLTVPTPIDSNRQPDLTPLMKACESVGLALQPSTVVVVESTVYPGVTEEICGPILARVSNLRQGVDFKLGYSPERINPGDKEHTLERIVKVVSGEDVETLDRVAAAYSAIIEAGVHRAPSIMVAEAAKVIENTQRDVNIALMNELALIFNRIGIRTQDVLDAARTKWNFLPFSPGLVGGHCIGVDPYYLTSKAESLGYHPQVILSGRRINDGMGSYVAQELVKSLIKAGHPMTRARVGILGLTFKENVRDLRNSRVPDIIAELEQYHIDTLVHDPLADPDEAREEYGIGLVSLETMTNLHAIILAVPHLAYREMPYDQLLAGLLPRGVVADVRSVLRPADIPDGVCYWSL